MNFLNYSQLSECLRNVVRMRNKFHVATVGNAKAFKNGRQFAAFLGIAPRHKGSGGKIEVLGMSKRGDGYVRKLIIHGARAVVTVSKEPLKIVTRLKKDHCTNKVIGAMTNKMARIMWALIAHESSYVKDYVQYRKCFFE